MTVSSVAWYTDLSQFSIEKQKAHHEESKSYGFGTTWGSVNDNIFTILVIYHFKFFRLQNVKHYRVNFKVWEQLNFFFFGILSFLALAVCSVNNKLQCPQAASATQTVKPHSSL